MKQSELARLRQQVKEQREALRRAQRWIGVAAGALAAAHTASGEKGFSYPLRDSVTDALACGMDISKLLKQYD